MFVVGIRSDVFVVVFRDVKQAPFHVDRTQ